VRRSPLSQALVVALTVFLGVAIAAQVRAHGHRRAAIATQSDQTLLLCELADANMRLRTEIDSLRELEASYGSDYVEAGLEELVAELNRVKVFNGTVEVSGPGVEVLVEGKVNALDLQDLVNELRNAGAEAIALNDQRLAVNSVVSVHEDGHLTVNGQRIDGPYRFLALGAPETLETALLRNGGLVYLLRRAYPNLRVQTTQHAKIVIGVIRPAITFRYARPID